MVVSQAETALVDSVDSSETADVHVDSDDSSETALVDSVDSSFRDGCFRF